MAAMTGGERQWQWAWIGAGLVLVPLVVFLQQFTRGLRETTLGRAPADRVGSERIDDPGVAQLTVASKLAAKVAYFVRMEDDGESPDHAEAMEEIDRIAVTRAERLRSAIVAGELLGTDSAKERIASLAKEATPDGDLARELHWLGVLYGEGRAAVPMEAQESLVDRHGWFGRLALSQGMPDRDPYRRELLGGIERLGVFTLVLMAASLIALVVGLFALGALWSGHRQGLLARGFEEGPRGIIHLETFVVFVGGFLVVLGLSLVPFGIGAEATVGALVFHEFLLWALVGVLAWPLVRRVPWGEFAAEIGLTRGAGVLTEVGCGVLGYAAGLPLFVGAAFLSSWIQSAGAGEGAEAGSHPLFEQPAVGSWVLLFLGTLSAVIWAPVIEESVFRGALYRWMRGWARPWLTILLTAVVFGLIHPYTPAGLIPVAVVGLTLGALREWRGSLIAPVTAHFLHNATISLVTIGFLVSLGD